MASGADRGVRGRRGKLDEGGLERLIEYAKSEFFLAKRREDGSTERQHLESVARQTKTNPPELNGPELPPDLEHVWVWFLDLHSRRGGNGFGANPLAWTDLLAWVYLMQPIIRIEELRAIMALDNAWMAMQAEDALSKTQSAPKAAPPPPTRR